MSHQGKSRPIFGSLKIATFVAVAAISLSHGALADTPSKRPHHTTPRPAAKCLCGYGISGYEAITCVPVADCEWEHAVCRGSC
jgi:hypothetical protein